MWVKAQKPVMGLLNGVLTSTASATKSSILKMLVYRVLNSLLTKLTSLIMWSLYLLLT